MRDPWNPGTTSGVVPETHRGVALAMKTAVVILAALTALAGCTSGDGDPMDGSPRSDDYGVGGRRDVSASGEPLAADDLVGAQWNGPAGDPAPSRVVNVIRGPDHCDWQSSIWLHLGWPVGTAAETAADIRQYVRDPRDVLPENVKKASLDMDAELPGAGDPTGYHVDSVELWLGDDGGDDAVYVVLEDHVERWPRTTEVIACE